MTASVTLPHVTPVLPKGYHVPGQTTTPPGGDTGAGGLGMTIAQTVLSAIISGAIMSRFLGGGRGTGPLSTTPEGNTKFLDGIAKALSDNANAKVAAGKSKTLGETLDTLLRSPTADMSPKQIDELFAALEPGAQGGQLPKTPTGRTIPPPARRSTGPKASDTEWNTDDLWSGPPEGTPKGVPYVSTQLKTPLKFGPGPAPEAAGLGAFVSGFPEMMQMLALVGANPDTARYKTVYGAHHQVVGYRGLTPAETRAANAADAKQLQSEWSWLTSTIRNLVYTPLMWVVNGIKGLGPAIGGIITGALSHIPGFGLGTNTSNPAFQNGQWVGHGQNAYRTHDANLQAPPSAQHGWAREFLADQNNQNGSWFYIRNGQHPPTGWHQTGGSAGFLRATGGLSNMGGLGTTLADIISQSGGTGGLGLAGRAVARAGGHAGNITINQYISGGTHDPKAIAHEAGLEARKVLQEFVQAL